MLYFLEILPLFLFCLPQTVAQDVLRCGGFIKSTVEINFSRVELKLYTKQGSLKYTTDCAPNNGYYIIPLYEKGDFVLKVDPPKGWGFEPSSVELHVDGKTDACSKEEDIDFHFTGFQVLGQVISEGSDQGPVGVTVILKQKNKDIQKLVTAEGGRYTFTAVLPGDYTLEASHKADVQFQKKSTTIKVTSDNLNVGSSLSVQGYDVTGKVVSEGETVKGVNFILFSDKELKGLKGCTKAAVSSVKGKTGQKQICSVLSGKDGRFVFPSIPVGQYTLVPYYKTGHIKFDVEPEIVDISVQHASVSIEKTFQVTGFSVSGRILDAVKGRGIQGATVSLNGKQQTKTGKNGEYHLENMKTGSYNLHVEANDVFFTDTRVKISPNTPQLQDIVASEFHVCGRIIIDKNPDGLPDAMVHQVTFHPKGKSSEVRQVSTNQGGEFCCRAKPGKYVFKVIVTEAEEKAGLKLKPSEKEVTITNSPIKNVEFSQFQIKVTGDIQCLEKCSDFSVSISPTERAGEIKIAELSDVLLRRAKFSFGNVLPGKYRVTLQNDRWCWHSKVKDITLGQSHLMELDFVQTGYVLSVTSSHELKLKFENLMDIYIGYYGDFDVIKGINTFCLEAPGRYKLTPESCHTFESIFYEFETGRPSAISLIAVHHHTEGLVTAKDKVKDLSVSIRSSLTDEDYRADLTLDDNKSPYKYRFSYSARSNEVLTIEPHSKEVLFYPPSAELTVTGETCPGVVAEFEARKGIFVEGKVNPAIQGVDIQILQTNTEQVIHTETDKKGLYRVGPLHSDTQYTVSASKDGYILTAVENKKGHFKAYKLGEIVVKVLDVKGMPIENVLLSLSGGTTYRNNNFTHSDGSRVFGSLGPGEYFLRQMKKEYRFEPSSQMIDVKEGSTVKLDVKATRVAFSCMGHVTSLNGEPEQGVIIEAAGQEGCSEYQEESQTELDGTFRIRGLHPNCEYRIRLKSDSANQHIERTAPEFKTIKVENADLEGVNIIAFRQNNQLDISGNVITSPDHLPSLKVELYNADNLDAPIHSVKMEKSLIFFLPSLEINPRANYIVRLSSTLSRASYEYDLAEKNFLADTHHKHFTFNFNPKRKSIDQELNRGSFLILPVTLLLVTVIYNYKSILPFLLQARSYLQSLMNKHTANSNNGNVYAEDFDETDYDTTISKKKKSRRA